jgi:CRISPR-associated protein Cas2
MWLVVMFDLPTHTKAERKAAAKFRVWLLDQGYEMSQWSVYLRFATGKEQVDKRVRDIDKARPRKGSVHVLAVTDRQFELMTVFRGDKTAKHRSRPDELALF